MKEINKDWLEKKYLNDHLNCQEIANLVGGITRQGIWKKLKSMGIPIRSKRDAIFFENGDQCKISQGYFWIYHPTHPRSNYKYVKRAVLVLEEKIGRSLVNGEFPHHIDHNRMNDNPNNLEITNRSKHMKDHNPILFRWNGKG